MSLKVSQVTPSWQVDSLTLAPAMIPPDQVRDGVALLSEPELGVAACAAPINSRLIAPAIEAENGYRGHGLASPFMTTSPVGRREVADPAQGISECGDASNRHHGRN